MIDRLSRPTYALGMLGLAMAVIPLNDALVKIMSSHISLGQIVMVRALLCLLLVLLFSRGFKAVISLPSPILLQFIGRSMCLVFAMLLLVNLTVDY